MEDRRHEVANEESLDRAMRVAFGPGSTEPASSGWGVRRSVSLDSFRVSSIRLRAGPGDLGPSLRPAGARDFEVPRQIGRYFIEGEIARGGVGAVFKARDLQLGRSVALKILRGGHRANLDLVRRFVEEAQIAGQLQHPGIVSVHDVGLFGDLRPFFVMKLVKGKTLAALLHQCGGGSVERQHFLTIFQQICQALGYAHSRGVIHRDLKPSNVMVGAFGDVQVMDWGLAKVLAAADADSADSKPPHADDSVVSTLRSGSQNDGSVVGSIIGTPSYMPPEQARGDVKALGEQADVFGLGAILCDIITGVPPYSGETLEETQGYARRGELSPALERLDTCGADPDVIRLAKDCLAFAPRDRPPHAGAVSERINSYLASLEERTRRLELETAEARGKALEEGRARRRSRALSILTLVALVLVGVVLLRLGSERARVDTEVEQVISGPTQVADYDAALQLVRDRAPRASAHMQPEIQEFERSVRLLQQLEKLPVMPPSYYDQDQDVDAWFRTAFTEYGLDLTRDVQQVAADIRNSKIRDELVLFLDVWSALRAETSVLPPTRQQLFDIATAADEANSWRGQLRSAIGRDDFPAVKVLAKEAKVARISDRRLVHLAAYIYRQDPDAAVALLRRTADAQKDSFWAHYWLGFVLALSDKEESRRHLYASVALRPNYARGLRRYGLSLFYAREFQGALSELTRAIRLDPQHSLASYQASMRILDRSEIREQREAIGPALDELIATLDEVIESGKGAPRAGKTLVAAWALRPRMDWHKPFDIATSQVSRTEGKDREALAMRAQVEWIKGDREDAVRTLEQVLRLNGELPANVLHYLEEWRRELSPVLVSYASVDAALVEAGASAAELAELLERVADVPALRVYLEGRIAQLDGCPAVAVERFGEASRLDGALPEPVLRLAEARRSSGESAMAERILFELLKGKTFDFPGLWNLWASIAMVDLGRTPEEILAGFPTTAPLELRQELYDERFIVYHYGEDLRWLLERLSGGEAVRVNCGGEGHQDWGRDRFFTRGAQFYGGIDRFTGQIAGRDEHLFATGRWFPTMEGMPSSYVFPLPPGRYRVTLRFAEIFYAAAKSGIRQFDVELEGKTVLTHYDTMARVGFAKVDDQPFDNITVDDGALDIVFRFVWDKGKKKGNPAISAIEIVPSGSFFKCLEERKGGG